MSDEYECVDREHGLWKKRKEPKDPNVNADRLALALSLETIQGLERENAALRARVDELVSNLAAAHEDRNKTASDYFHAKQVEIPELLRENAALREALQSAENALQHALMMKPLDPFKRGKIISEALDVVRSAIKEAQP